MQEDNKKVIMIDGKNSEWYEKAIFIMRGDVNTDNKPVDFINEAEKIINSYIIKSASAINEIKFKSKSKINNDKKFDTILNVCLVCSIIILAVTVYRLCV